MPAKRSARPPLSVAVIHQAALDLIQRDGLEALSMRSLAKVLNVDPMAIYHHIPNKASLLSGLYETVLVELFEDTAPLFTWQERLKALLRRFRTLAKRSPNLFPGLIASSHSSLNIARAIDLILGNLLEAGLSPKMAVQASDTVLAFLTGFVLLELNPPEHPEAVFVDQAELPYLERLRPELRANPLTDSFEFGLQLLIQSIEMSAPK
jgi:TetR/AcrR family transcriptional regulator, tetracycline repressor protein